MESDLMSQLVAFVQVIFIDLVLAGDNAIVVGMAAASVPIDQRRRVIIWGTAAAVVLRIAFALVTTQLLQIIGLTLAGGLLLFHSPQVRKQVGETVMVAPAPVPGDPVFPCFVPMPFQPGPDAVDGRADVADHEIRHRKAVFRHGGFDEFPVPAAHVGQCHLRPHREQSEQPGRFGRLISRPVRDQRSVQGGTDQQLFRHQRSASTPSRKP
jgi:hypothetical protein